MFGRKRGMTVIDRVKVLFMGAVDPVSTDDNLYAPLWPAYLAANAKRRIGLERFEFCFMKGPVEEALDSCKPDILAISSVTQNYNHAIHYARSAKNRGVAVLVGGMHISSLPECLSEDMDVGCIGEGEETFADLMALYLEKGFFDADGLSGIKGIIYREQGKLVRTTDRPVIEAVDQLPHPDRSIIGYGRRAYIYTARGCAYNCTFCICSRYWGKIRYVSPRYIMEEIELLLEKGVEVIRFSDENFVGNKQRLSEISGLIKSAGIDKRVKFSCWARAQNVTPDVVKMLKSMNVVSVKMGLESGSERILRLVKGNTTLADSKRAINLLKDAGIQTNGDFIIGFPDETEAEIMETYRFIKESRLDFVDINTICPLPGTEVWEEAERKGMVSASMDWGRLNYKFNYDSEKAMILSETLDYDSLSRIHRKFRRLRAAKMMRALLTTPWRKEIPGMAYRVLAEKVGKKQRQIRATVPPLNCKTPAENMPVERE